MTVHPCCVDWNPWLGSPITTKSGKGYNCKAASNCQNVDNEREFNGVKVLWQISVRAN